MGVYKILSADLKRKGFNMAENFYCKWCGQKYPSVVSLTAGSCSRNPEGKKHELYEGSEKSQYTCKYCGQKFSSLVNLTTNACSKSPHKKHAPAM
jgi:transcription elongation factor Elf1